MTFFVMDDWCFRAGILSFILAVLAACAPQWIYTIPNSISFGLRATCFGNKCFAMDFGLLKASLDCSANCADAFDQFRLRWRAIEGFGWIGAMLLLTAA